MEIYMHKIFKSESVAVIGASDPPRIIGPDRRDGEFSIAVGDPWQGKGVGRKLLQRCLDANRDQGVSTVHGSVLTENQQMLRLGRKLEFRVSQGEDARTFHLSHDPMTGNQIP
jgi:acetyltransferase